MDQRMLNRLRIPPSFAILWICVLLQFILIWSGSLVMRIAGAAMEQEASKVAAPALTAVFTSKKFNGRLLAKTTFSVRGSVECAAFLHWNTARYNVFWYDNRLKSCTVAKVCWNPMVENDAAPNVPNVPSHVYTATAGSANSGYAAVAASCTPKENAPDDADGVLPYPVPAKGAAPEDINSNDDVSEFTTPALDDNYNNNDKDSCDDGDNAVVDDDDYADNDYVVDEKKKG